MEPTHPRLAPREKDCLRLVPELRTSKAIAHRLGLTPETTSQYIKAAMRKLGASDRYEAARLLATLEVDGNSPPMAGVLPTREVFSDDENRPEPPCRVEPTPDVSTLREEALHFDVRPNEWVRGRPVAPQQKGLRNADTVPQRLRSYFTYGLLALMAFLAFSTGLLVLSAVDKELGIFSSMKIKMARDAARR